MNMFIVGSHHRNISVLFLMKNIFQKGTHARTISINIQYMVLFKNARDQSQIRTLAIQIFPTNWNDFLAYYGRKRIRIMDTLFLIFIRKLPMINILSSFIELRKPFQTLKMYLNNKNHTKNQNKISNKTFWKQNSNNNNLSTNQNIYLKRRKKNKTFLRQRTFYQNNRKS